MQQMGILVFAIGALATALLYPLVRFNANKTTEKKHERTKLDF